MVLSLRPALVFCLLALAAPAAAQVRGEAPAIPGGERDQGIRLEQLLGRRTADGYLVRSLGAELARIPLDSGDLILIGPEFHYGNNSAHPWGWNDGPLRSAKGNNTLVTLGVAVRMGRVTLQIVPQFVHEENRALRVFTYGENQLPARSPWANRFHSPPESIDQPLRYGDTPRTTIAGQHRLAVDLPYELRMGVSNENRWWGPGVRNALLLGSTAAGFEHAFIESRQPIETAVGDFSGQWILGRLSESEYFDFDRTNDQRALSALALTWRPPDALSALVPELGLARAVMRAERPGLRHVFDFVADVGRPYADSSDARNGADQITSLFARWLVPERGFEAWMEWARYEQPLNLRDLLVNPGHSQGYTVGFSWARPARGGTLLVQSEFTYAEPSASLRVRPAITPYTSASVPQGWTHRGELIGPSIGQGGSSQWGNVDWRSERWRFGAALGRLRRNNGQAFVFPSDFTRREDVSIWATLRAGRRIGPVDALIEFTDAGRFNYLFQTYELPPEEGGWAGIDLANRTLTVTLTPRFFRLGIP